MRGEEKLLIADLANTMKALSERQDSYERTSDLRLKRLENDVDLLEIAVDRFHELLAIFEKLIHRIKTAFLESRIWEELEELRRNDGRKNHQRESTAGFDVKRKSGRSSK